ncbi:lipoprotein [Rossellomorea sp. GCM10028870]
MVSVHGTGLCACGRKGPVGGVG